MVIEIALGQERLLADVRKMPNEKNAILFTVVRIFAVNSLWEENGLQLRDHDLDRMIWLIILKI